MSGIEEIIFSRYCGIELEDLKADEVLDPNKIKVSAGIYDKIVADIKEEYPTLSKLEINLILLQYGANVDENLKGDEIRLLDGYIRGREREEEINK